MIIYYTTFPIICQSDKYLKEEIHMSLTYLVEILGTESTEDFSPSSVVESEWYATLLAAIETQGGTIDATSFTLKFDSQDEYTAWIERYKLTDATLIDDLRAWNTARGFSYKCELRTDDGTLITPLKVVPLD
jgi:hypothetical protein